MSMLNKIYTVSYSKMHSVYLSCETKIAFNRYEAQKIFDDWVREIADRKYSKFKYRVLDYLGESSMSWYNYILDKRDFILIEEHDV